VRSYYVLADALSAADEVRGGEGCHIRNRNSVAENSVSLSRPATEDDETKSHNKHQDVARPIHSWAGFFRDPTQG